jgi:radical SAM superfamily enzyme YgiQ (UPF0313 family)
LRVLIVNTNQEKSPQALIPLGAHLVAEATRQAGHEVQFLDLCFARRPVPALERLLERHEFDVIGLSIRNLDNCDYCAPRTYLPAGKQIADACRRRSSATVVIGGSAVSQAPQAMLDFLGADVAIPGEGEAAFPAFLHGVDAGKAPKGVIASPLAPQTPDPPPLRPELVDNLRTYRGHDGTWPLQTKRGCALRCSYCAYPNIEGSGWRLRDPAAVAEDLIAAKASALPMVEFVDGVFGLPQAHAIDCCEAVARAATGLPLCTMELNPGAVTPELVAAMNAANFHAVAITAESGSDAMLSSYGKNYAADDLHRAAQLLRGLKAHKLWIFMLGGPGETPDTVRETGRFLDTLPETDLVYVTHGVRVLPQTALQQRLTASGDILSGDDLLWPSFYHSPHVTPRQSEALLEQSSFPSLNRVTASDGNNPLAVVAQRIVTRVGLKPPYWRYIRQINRVRRALRL